MIDKELGQYLVVEALGEGGMASVYKGYDKRLDRDVAIKVILPGFSHSSAFQKRFEREAKSIARLTHINIVKVINYGFDEGVPYLVMEYVPGGTLNDLLGKPIHWQRSAQMLVPVARALEYAHRRNIVHRDIKPANFLVTDSGDLVVSDFGIAKTLDADLTKLTGTGVSIGTPAYMSPEQGLKKEIDHRADIYSLGVVFFEMVTGKTPYEADTPFAVMMKHVTEPLPSPSDLVPDIPEAVEEVLFKALAKNPDDRYQSMSEFAETLEELWRNLQPKFLVGKADLGSTKSDITIKETHELTRPPNEISEITKTTKKRPKKFNVKIVGVIGLIAVVITTIVVGFQVFRENKNLLELVKGSKTPIPIEDHTVFPISTATQKTAMAIETASPTITPELSFTNTPEPSPSITSTETPETLSQFITDPYGVSMALIPAGSFIMGNDGYATSKPTHTVLLDAFYIDQYEVTNVSYKECVDAKICKVPTSSRGEHISDYGSNIRDSYYNNKLYADYPKIFIRWNDAQTYCQWRGARLPTEAEWEKAARGGLDGALYPWGDQAVDCSLANIRHCFGDTTQVGSFAPNGYGLYDMIGNVYEWVADWYDRDYYQISPESNPTGPGTGQRRVYRGGSWAFGSYTVSSRSGDYPVYTHESAGFRCARDISNPGTSQVVQETGSPESIVSIPNLIGMSYPEAEELIRNMGIEAFRIWVLMSDLESPVESGTVISQEPIQGEYSEKIDTVDISVAGSLQSSGTLGGSYPGYFDLNIQFLESKTYTFEISSNCDMAITLDVYDPDKHHIFNLINDDIRRFTFPYNGIYLVTIARNASGPCNYQTRVYGE